MRELIYAIVKSFYERATKDILIGYHFDKFNSPEVLSAHLERITSFWEMQLTGSTSRPIETPFQLLFTHLQLKIKRGELGRWVMLFHQTLDELEDQVDHPNIKAMNDLWKQKIALFEERFKAHPHMFG